MTSPGSKQNATGLRERLFAVALPAITLLAAAAIWEIAVVVRRIPPYVLPGPILVVQTLFSDWTILWSALRSTLTTTIEGLLFAVLGGVGLAILFSQSRLAEYAIYPYEIGRAHV